MPINEPISLANSWINRDVKSLYKEQYINNFNNVNNININNNTFKQISPKENLKTCDSKDHKIIKSKSKSLREPVEEYCCSICKGEYDLKEAVHLQCYHFFHYDCILQWYNHTKNDMETARTCPLCRQYGGFLPKKSNMEEIEDVHFPSDYLKFKTHKMGINEFIDLISKYIKNLGLKINLNDYYSQTSNLNNVINSQINSPYYNSPINDSNISYNHLSSNKCYAIIGSKKSKNYGLQCNHTIKNGLYCGVHSYLNTKLK